MHQRRIGVFAKGRDKAIGGQLLAGAGTSQLGGQCSFEGLCIKRDVLGKAIDQQVTKPHEGVTLQVKVAKRRHP
ncbi:hypothetical protein D3C84_1110730 [compost metagenome]